MNNTTKLNKSEHSLFLIVKTEVISIVLLHWPSIYIQQHNKEPSTCRTSGRGLAHLGSSDEPHGSMSPSLFWHWLPAERCRHSVSPISQGLSSGQWSGADGGGCVPVPPALLQGGPTESHMVSLLCIRMRHILIKRLGSQARPR